MRPLSTKLYWIDRGQVLSIWFDTFRSTSHHKQKKEKRKENALRSFWKIAGLLDFVQLRKVTFAQAQRTLQQKWAFMLSNAFCEATRQVQTWAPETTCWLAVASRSSVGKLSARTQAPRCRGVTEKNETDKSLTIWWDSIVVFGEGKTHLFRAPTTFLHRFLTKFFSWIKSKFFGNFSWNSLQPRWQVKEIIKFGRNVETKSESDSLNGSESERRIKVWRRSKHLIFL